MGRARWGQIMILGVDLGGTKTLLALAEVVDGRPVVIRERRFLNRDYRDFDAILGEFLADAPALQGAAIGVAGPTDGREVQPTYLPWRLSAEALSAKFRLGPVTLVNDLAAAALGLPLLDPAQLTTLQAGQPLVGQPCVMLGAGTGLGVVGMVWQEGAYRAIPGEGGHMGFSPQTLEQDRLWLWLLEQRGRVTWEDVVSGPGLGRIHLFLGGEPRTPEGIGQVAMSGSDARAQQALALWFAAFGAFAGDLALHWLARGGVYLTGGIAPRLMPHLDPAPFLQAFNAKREHRHLAEAMPVQLVRDERVALLGALALAQRQLAG